MHITQYFFFVHCSFISFMEKLFFFFLKTIVQTSVSIASLQVISKYPSLRLHVQSHSYSKGTAPPCFPPYILSSSLLALLDKQSSKKEGVFDDN